MKNCFIIIFLLGNVHLLFGQSIIAPVQVKKIWDKGDHNAFTDLTFFKGKFYCSFREGSGHVPGNEDVDGKARILTSVNGTNWESVALLEKAGYDLRDPKLSITPDNRLMVIMGGSDYDKNILNGLLPHVSFSEDGNNFTEPEAIIMEESIKSNDDWIWRVTWYNNVGFAVNYRKTDRELQENKAFVVTTKDGVHYNKLSELFVSGYPNEATIRFSKEGEMLIYLRRETQGKEGLLLKSKYPYKEYTWVNMEHRLGGPNFIFLPNTNKLILGTRLYSENGATTGLLISDYHGNQTLIAELPSGGDTSYPGLLWHDGFLWVSYYSTHEGKTSIYLAKIKQSDIYLSLQE